MTTASSIMRYALRTAPENLRLELRDAMTIASSDASVGMFCLRWRLQEGVRLLVLRTLAINKGDIMPLRVYQRALEKRDAETDR
jgi:hypothetical protein